MATPIPTVIKGNVSIIDSSNNVRYGNGNLSIPNGIINVTGSLGGNNNITTSSGTNTFSSTGNTTITTTTGDFIVNSAGVDINSAGTFSADSVGNMSITSTGGTSITNITSTGGSSSTTVSSSGTGGTTLSSTNASGTGTQILSNAAGITATATGGPLTLSTTGSGIATLTTSGSGNANLTTTGSGNATLTTTGSGSVVINSVSNIDIDSTTNITINALTTLDCFSNGNTTIETDGGTIDIGVNVNTGNVNIGNNSNITTITSNLTDVKGRLNVDSGIITEKEIVAPSIPAPSYNNIYVDSGSKKLRIQNNGGILRDIGLNYMQITVIAAITTTTPTFGILNRFVIKGSTNINANNNVPTKIFASVNSTVNKTIIIRIFNPNTGLVIAISPATAILTGDTIVELTTINTLNYPTSDTIVRVEGSRNAVGGTTRCESIYIVY